MHSLDSITGRKQPFPRAKASRSCVERLPDGLKKLRHDFYHVLTEAKGARSPDDYRRELNVMKILWIALALTFPSAVALAQHAPYAGQQARAVKSFSDDELQELRRGGGMGFAKPAELNGLPGPAHVLELADTLGLSPAQKDSVQQLFKTMAAEAIAVGERLIAAEAVLDKAFQNRAPSDDELRRLISQAEAQRANLRYIHLVTHLRTPTILTPAQISQYNELRGYGKSGCPAAPAGHDPVLWHRHQGC